MNLKNTYFLLRHGQAHSNRDGFVSSWPEKVYNPLTNKGRKQIEKSVLKLKKEKIDLIFSSDLLRAKQTAEIIFKTLRIKPEFDKRLGEIGFGVLNGKKESEWKNFFHSRRERFTRKPKGGENYRDIKKRAKEFLQEINKKYKNKKILIISHASILFSFQSIAKNFNEKQESASANRFSMETGELKNL